MISFRLFSRFLVLLMGGAAMVRAEPVNVSGIYPHLAFFNDEAECGTGAVVPWADRLWAVTYAPHSPTGSSDNLYEITPELDLIVRPESIGGTPANRMIHRESNQLFIGPYAIDARRNVRVIPYSKMFGRPTANARHLSDPKRKIYYGTMEEGLYEVDVHSLAVKELWRDEQQEGGRKSDLPGYHGKGLYSGQGALVYANNGEHGKQALQRPDVASGVLAQWDGKGTSWTVVRRNQFTEVTGPGGIYGNTDPVNDPLWTIGWDHRSLILMCLDGGKWHSWRIPKGSHSYDGAHGWNTEWPRIRDIGEDDLLMTMHGTFWRFPKTFSAENSAGIAPRSNYLKVIGDFCRWNDRVVFGCDDTAKNEFLNTRKAKGKIAAPQSQSNLWFVETGYLDEVGPVIGRGALWLNDSVKADEPSDAYMFNGYAKRCLHLVHGTAKTVEFELEVDQKGDGIWSHLDTVSVPAGQAVFHEFDEAEAGVWIRATASLDCTTASLVFSYRGEDNRTTASDAIFDGLAQPGDEDALGGLVRALAGNKWTLGYAAMDLHGNAGGYYELNQELKLVRRDDPAAQADLVENTQIPQKVLVADEASILFVDDDGQRWRLPRGDAGFGADQGFPDYRVAREVATERDLFNAGGTFYELPARNAGGFSRVRAVATHNRMIQDFCSYAGLLVMSGVAPTALEADVNGSHIVRSDDGKAALWVGAADDIWRLGKPRGSGGPWNKSVVKAGEASDPYLLTGFDEKRLTLSADRSTTITAEIDITGGGDWVDYRSFGMAAGVEQDFQFPSGFQAYWIRFKAGADCRATAMLRYM